MNDLAPSGERYLGLSSIERTIPSAWYRDPTHHARELARIWYRNWVYLCHERALAAPLSFRTFRIGDQSILVLREDKGSLQAFHNTCRHRGSELCKGAEGRLRSKLLVCPYHNWGYSLQGELVRVPHAQPVAGFDTAGLGLYRVHLRCWRGLVFVNLAGKPAPLEDSLEPSGEVLANWPLERLVVGHSFRKELACNWKLFWENYNECLHCPGMHPELCDLVPLYGRAIMDRRDDPGFAAHADATDPRFTGGLKAGARTWSMNGQLAGPEFPDLTAEERATGQTFVTILPTMFLVAHPDYVRTVRLMPLGPTRTELLAEWLFPEETLAAPGFDLANTVDFATLVMSQDGEACEINQRGLAALPHREGVLMPQEYEISRFHRWVREMLNDHDKGGEEP